MAATPSRVMHAIRTDQPGRRVILIALLGLFELASVVAPSTGSFPVAIVATWLIVVLFFVGLCLPPNQSEPGGGEQDTRRFMLPTFRPTNRAIAETGAMLGLLAFAATLRLVQLESYPPLFHGDEGEMGVAALAIAQGRPDAPPFFGTAWLEHPSVHFYLEAISIRLFGVTEYALRFVTAVWGTVGVAATWFVGRELVSKRAGYIAAIMAASAPVDLQLSRTSLNNVETAVLQAVAIALAVRSIRLAREDSRYSEPRSIWQTGAAWYAALSGTAAGLSLYFYFASRLVPLIVALAYGAAWLWFPRARRRVLGAGAIASAGIVLIVLPLVAFLARHPDARGMGRLGTYFLLNHLPDVYQSLHVHAAWQAIVVQSGQSLGQFFTRPDGSTFFPFGAPILLAPVAALFGGGILLAALGVRRYTNAVLLLWFWTTLIVGNVLLMYAPYTPRIVGALPAVYVLAASSVDWIWSRMASIGSRTLARQATALVALVLTAITASSIDHYFFVYFQRDMLPPVTTIARFLSSLPSGTYVYDLADGLYFGYGPNRYLAYWIQGEDLTDPPGQVPILVPKSRRVAFIVFAKWTNQLDVLIDRFPGGRRVDHQGPDGRPSYSTYLVDLDASATAARGKGQ